MPLILDVDKDIFCKACQKVESIDDLMDQFNLTREQVKHLRKRLKSSGRNIPSLQNRKSDKVVEQMPNMTTWERARAVLGGRVRYCSTNGYTLDGKHSTVQTIIKESGLTLSP